jgi:hypothetical protein
LVSENIRHKRPIVDEAASAEVDENSAVAPALGVPVQTEQNVHYPVRAPGNAQRSRTQLSEAELIVQLAQLAKELGIEIDLNYSFAQPKKTIRRT